MPSTRTLGITIDAAGHRIIDKEHRSIRIFLRLGAASQEDAEHRLDAEVSRIESELEQKANSYIRFCDCAARYLAECQHKRSVDVLAWHIRLPLPYLGTLAAQDLRFSGE